MMLRLKARGMCCKGRESTYVRVSRRRRGLGEASLHATSIADYSLILNSICVVFDCIGGCIGCQMLMSSRMGELQGLRLLH